MSTYNELGPGGASTLTPYMSSFVNNYALTANTARTIAWPSGYQFCNIVGNGTNDYFVNATTTATVPSGDITNGSGSARNVAQRQRGLETGFSVISGTTQTITIEFWSGNSSM